MISDMHAAAKSPRHPIWALLWRMVLFGPILWTLGLGFFVVVLASVVGLPFFAVIIALDDHSWLGAGLFVAWIAWYRHGKRLLGWLLQGIEFSSL